MYENDENFNELIESIARKLITEPLPAFLVFQVCYAHSLCMMC